MSIVNFYSYPVKALKFVIMSVPKMITKSHKEKKNKQLLMQQAKQKVQLHLIKMILVDDVTDNILID